MCTGVTRGFAGIKFSGSVSKFGAYNTINMKIDKAERYPRMSFAE